MFDLNLHKEWIDVLKSLDGKKITKKEMYDLRASFYEKK